MRISVSCAASSEVMPASSASPFNSCSLSDRAETFCRSGFAPCARRERPAAVLTPVRLFSSANQRPERGGRSTTHACEAFDHDRAACRADRRPRLGKVVELAPLLEKRSLWRVEVLRFPIAEHAAPEGNHRGALVEDGKHDAVAKPVITASPALRVDHEA